MKTLSALAKYVAIALLVIGLARGMNVLPRPDNLPAEGAWTVWWETWNWLAGLIAVFMSSVFYILFLTFRDWGEAGPSPHSCPES